LLSSYLAQRTRKVSDELALKHQALESLRVLHENIVRSVKIGLLILDNKGQLAFANAAADEILGANFSAKKGMPFRMLASRIPLPKGPADRFEFIWERHGQQVHVNGAVADLIDATGSVQGKLITLEDSTALKKMEVEMKRADRLAAVGQMAAGLAHEIRNPLASLSGSVQLLSDELKLEPDQKNLMNIVVREADRLNNLISDFLTFARPVRKTEEPVDLTTLITEIASMLQYHDDFKDGMTIDAACEPNLTTYGDGDQLRQIFWNLALNAVQAMPGVGSVVIRGAAIEENGANWICISVQDQGPGIPPQNLEIIFDPFFTTKDKGTGLGLTIAYAIAERHGGRISVANAQPSGSVFEVRLPVQKMV
jgi:two-component system, NtrC family, sensor histidine kinase PilS